MSRQRIVINLDAPDAGPASARAADRGKRRRWPKVLGILLTIVAVVIGAVAIGGFLLWRHYQTKPAYALSLMIDAAQRGDMTEFAKRLDDEEIAKNMVARVSEKASARYGLALSNKVKAQIDSTLPGLLQQLKPVIHNEVAKEIAEFASKSEPRPFIFLVVAVPSLMTITTEGDSSTASATINDRRFEIAMRRGADGWKVTDFKDDVVVQRIVDNVMTQLPAIGGLDANAPFFKQNRRPRRR
ncbi:MAG TPA: hypothetical protein VHH35_00735 [Pyrinomonadaceae bacterium]|nr:hypothetical protein [Pyrinomonadaceae bacterium]